ncbi:unnamed protein product [Caenorhabditis brenneri]
MKLLIVLFLFLITTTSAQYPAGSFLPRHMPIPPQVQFPEAVEKPGLYAWHFLIPENSTETMIDIQGIEWMAQLAERRRCDLSILIEVEENRNISFVLNKCGFESTTFAQVIHKEVLIVPPSYFTVISNLGSIGCTKTEKRLLFIIQGLSNTTGTIDFNFFDPPASVNACKKVPNVYFIPLLVGMLLVIGGFVWSPKCCCRKKAQSLPKVNKQLPRWSKNGKLRSYPGVQGTFV